MANDIKNIFKEVSATLDLNRLEEQVLAFWSTNNIFQKSVDQRSSSPEYIFYDGPPFANGLPHYGHILTSYVKDTVPRYFTMRGKRVERRFGWDCHGLPAENSAEKELNLSGRKQIEAYGIDQFNRYCRSSVLKYTDIWQSMMTRLGRWVDFSHDYKTMDISYMESILWAFKTLHTQGLIYEGNKVLHYCYRCQTPLSNFEANLDDSYRLTRDTSVTVLFKSVGQENTYFAVWTTTPWTLPSNVLLAVGLSHTYVFIQINHITYIMAEECISRYEEVLKGGRILKKVLGKELIGLHYEPLFPYFKTTANAFKVSFGDFVTTDSGTGIVHIAPAFGEDDAQLGMREAISAPDPVDPAGCFTPEVTDFAGKNVHQVNEAIIYFLEQRKQVLKKETVEHDYPFCWRCDTPLIYKATPSWYLAVSKIKSSMIRNNQKINWIPEHIKNGIFGKWLEGAKDWAISRNRYFGAPVPVWKCDRCHDQVVVGSLKEIESLSGIYPTDLHRPAIDRITWPCKICGGAMHRVSEVLDCWFESGSMPYAQLHYPFENQERFEKHFPADFIVEYVAQTRGWFYTLVVLSSALFDKPPFRNALVHGVIFAEDGRKMSKRLNNFPDPNTVLKKYGSDAMRFYFLNSPVISGKNISFSEEGVQEVVRSVLLPLWNAYRFFITYANADQFVPASQEAEEPCFSQDLNYLDRYILSKLYVCVHCIQTFMDNYELAKACREVVSFIDSVNNTYIRRSRRRFWKNENDADKKEAYQTLYFVLVTLCRVIAPLLPFMAEEIYKNLTEKESVHLENWPSVSQACQNEALITEIEQVQQIIKVGRTIREKMGVKVREPRSKVIISGLNLDRLLLYQEWIQEELNVKQVEIQNNPMQMMEKHIKLDFKKLGSRLGKEMQRVNQQIKSGKFELINNKIKVLDSILIESNEYQIEYQMPEGTLKTDDGRVMVHIDMTETEALKKEGIVRDIVRHIQLLRKEADFNVSDRIDTLIQTSGLIHASIEDFQDYIKRETLTIHLNEPHVSHYERTKEMVIDDIPVILSVKRTSA